MFQQEERRFFAVPVRKGTGHVAAGTYFTDRLIPVCAALGGLDYGPLQWTADDAK